MNVTLYRPATPAQLTAIAGRAWREFGYESLLDGHFYPMLHRDYARLLARCWNAREYGTGYVLACTVDGHWLGRLRPQTVATARQLEYRIPAAQLAAFNARLQGPIRLLESHGSDGPAPWPRTDPLPRLARAG